MDKKDKTLLYELSKNSRAPYSVLAKAIRSSQETTRYRVKRLIDNGVIKKFMMLTNVNLLGNSIYQIFLKLQNVKLEDKENLINFLKENNKISWVGDLEGNFDIGFIIVVKDHIELQSLVNSIYKRFSNQIMKKELSLLLEGEFFHRDYLIHTKRHLAKVSSYSGSKQSLKIDNKDKEICLILAENARISLVEIGGKVKLSEDAISQRIKKLTSEGIITGYTIDINQDKLNQLHYKILLRLNNFSDNKITNLLSFVRANVRVTAFIQTLAEWDYEIDLEVESPTQIKQFTMEITSEFSDIVRDFEIIRIVDMPKFVFFLPENS